MEQKPFHYDGSVQAQYETSEESHSKDSFELTESVRLSISSNPYFLNQWE